jgi:hypothetical protein
VLAATVGWLTVEAILGLARLLRWRQRKGAEKFEDARTNTFKDRR